MVQEEIDLVLLDYTLPKGMTGLDFYMNLKAKGQDLPVIMVTAFSDEATIIKALRAGVRDFVTKSTAYLDYLPEAVRRVLSDERTKKALARSEVSSNVRPPDFVDPGGDGRRRFGRRSRREDDPL